MSFDFVRWIMCLLWITYEFCTTKRHILQKIFNLLFLKNIQSLRNVNQHRHDHTNTLYSFVCFSQLLLYISVAYWILKMHCCQNTPYFILTEKSGHCCAQCKYSGSEFMDGREYLWFSEWRTCQVSQRDEKGLISGAVLGVKTKSTWEASWKVMLPALV